MLLIGIGFSIFFSFFIHVIYSHELEIKKKDCKKSESSVSNLDISLENGNNRNPKTKRFDKRGSFKFSIVNFPYFLAISLSHAYGDFVSKLIRYVRVCSKYELFRKQGKLFANKLIKQDYQQSRFNDIVNKKIFNMSNADWHLYYIFKPLLFTELSKNFLCSRLLQRAHGWNNRTAEDTHSSMAAELTSIFVEVHVCSICYCFVFCIFPFDFELCML